MNIFVIEPIRNLLAVVSVFFGFIDLAVADGAGVKNVAVFGDGQAPHRLVLFREPVKKLVELGFVERLAWPAVNHASVSKVANILIFITSDVSEQRRKEDYYQRRPRAVNRQVIRLPFFEGGERIAASQEAEIEHGGPRQIDQEGSRSRPSRPRGSG